MTATEAINTINSLKQYYNDKNEDSYVGFDNEDNEALEMAIKALEQHPCEDCISREEIINELKLGYFNKDLQEGKNDPCVIDAMIDWAIRTAKRLPSVTPKGVTITDFADRCRECGRIKFSNLQDWLSIFNTESATECFTAVQRLKERVNE